MVRSAVLAFLSFGTLLAALCATTPVQAASPLTVGILSAPVMGYRDANHQVMGFEGELAQQICERIKRQCIFVLQPFSTNISDIRQGRIDLAFSNILVTEARSREFVFSERYMRSVSYYVGNPNTQPKYRSTRVAVIKGSVHAFYLQQNHSAAMEAVVYTDISDIYAALKRGDVDLVLLSTILQLGFLYSDESGLFDLIGNPIESSGLAGDIAVAINPAQKQLKPDIDQALRSLLTDGSFNRLNNKYFPFNIY
ncbi:substrate-binding periplasmic protein [Oceanospirillum linum]|uniref:Solute-binding protein family 3/N-terminal domain-containing protein n=1 Tax=Oceanospirillum linum TaxID=966 RepID=A0A1T1HD83_OCELI|nr:transporter substrate-binding domain-containing protein [Oceanospirillum linum]OOV87785.1 hypothetical protein BTA35_0207205 [Oceanospirillum linum]SEG12414.1 amino acid ABC transporter substrate-binding protein, PAAT family [Oleiphilus messinensis]SMP09663.1 amino acid ABC transporter substrate-binding protein, PAAT family [Oceanospirillum linum]